MTKINIKPLGTDAEAASMTDTPHQEKLHEVRPATAAKAGYGFTLFGMLVISALGAGFAFVYLKKAASETELARETSRSATAPAIVEVVSVVEAPATHPLTLPGSVAAWYQSTIYARVDGYVANWTADIGDHVKKGQILALLETPDMDSRLVAAQAKVAVDQVLIAERRSNAEFAKSTLKRWNDSPKGVVSDQERDAKKAANDDAIGKLNEALAQLGLDKAEAERYVSLVNFKNVVAPYDGVITERRIDVGNLVTAGSNTNTTLLYRIQQDDPLRINIDVPQSAALGMQPGTAVAIHRDDGSSVVFRGSVTRTANEIDHKTRTLRVEVDLPNPDHKLVPGMYVDVTFDIVSKGLLQVPPAALVFRSSGAEIGVVDESNRIYFRKVSIVQDYGNLVELGSGVAAGERVALNINSEIADGDQVEVHETKVNVSKGDSAKPR